MKRIIVGTAGHIDHGKTALVRALTGIDADRLKEEKERGITIDIGFADLTLADIHFGFVDVPGHERFVKNMLAGAHGIDLVMLVVAADEGVMPQTREHFDICRLLEIKSGLVVVTKADLADEDLLELVKAEIEDFVKGSFLEGAPVLCVSSKTGQGLEELKKTLTRLAAKVPTRDANAIARLPIDRVFTVKGFGTVVTGTLITGNIKMGDELELMPSNGLISRVRGLQVHGHSTSKVQAGERSAINLQGIEVAEVSRGQVLVPAGRFSVTQMINVKLHLLAGAPRKLRTRSRVRVHHGTAEVLARVALIDKAELPQGESAYAQLRLESPILALPNDRLIIRSYSPSITIGGGVVIDARPQKFRARERSSVVARLEQLQQADEKERIALLVEMAGERGMNHAEIAARSGATDETIKQAAESLIQLRRLIAASNNPLLLIARPAFDELAKRVRIMLKEFHQKFPLESGIKKEELREKLFTHLPAEIFRAVVAHVVERGEVIAEKDLLRLSSHRVALSTEEQAAKEHLSALFARAALQPISLDEVLTQFEPRFTVDQKQLHRFAHMLINSGELVRVADMIFHKTALEELSAKLQRFKQQHGAQIDVSAFKELTGVSRKYAIPLLEYLDRQKITRRIGDAREIL